MTGTIVHGTWRRLWPRRHALLVRGASAAYRAHPHPVSDRSSLRPAPLRARTPGMATTRCSLARSRMRGMARAGASSARHCRARWREAQASLESLKPPVRRQPPPVVDTCCRATWHALLARRPAHLSGYTLANKSKRHVTTMSDLDRFEVSPRWHRTGRSPPSLGEPHTRTHTAPAAPRAPVPTMPAHTLRLRENKNACCRRATCYASPAASVSSRSA